MSGLSSKKAWRELNQVLSRKGSHGIQAVQTPNGRLTDRQSIVDEFNRHFSSWSGISGSDNVNAEHHFTMLPVNSRFKFERVEEEEILELLGCLDLNKATGLDGISCRMLKTFAPAICRSLTSLFNYSLEMGQVASEWKLARVTPVPKGGCSEKVEDFRPVSVLSVVTKLLERVVHRQLYAYLHNHSILNVAQSGFGPGHTTQDVLVATVDDWRQFLDEG